MHRVCIVDDEENIGRSLRLILEREGFAVSTARSAAEFAALPAADAYLLDLRLPDASGLDLLRQVRQADARVPVLLISGHGSIADAVEALRAGANDFLEKPLSRDRVLVSLRNALEAASLRAENDRLREIVGDPHRMVFVSEAFRHLVEQATLASRSDARVLLMGESGTGKELLAAHVHQNSPFAAGPFVKVNCAAIPGELLESELFGHEKGAFTGAAAQRRGRFEQAHGGTLFLDEVGDLPLPSQAKLLRVLQEGEFHRVGGERPIRVSVRVVSATNRDLTQLAAQERFREDLYYRLCVVPLRVPPLRERPDDVAPLAAHFLDEFCRRNSFRPKQFAPDVLPLLARHPWPGNARELRNVVERMAILSPGDVLPLAAVPLEVREAPAGAASSSLQHARDAAERDRIARVLEQEQGNVSRAARALGVERTSLHKRIRALGLQRTPAP